MFLSVLKIFFFLIAFYRKSVKTIRLLPTKILFIYMLSTYLFHVWLFLIRTKRSRDIQQHLWPKPNSCQSFSICHWNINSISARNFVKLSLLRAFSAIQKFDIVCLSETYLNASISNDDDSLEVPGYILLEQAIHLILKEEVFCIYYIVFIMILNHLLTILN